MADEHHYLWVPLPAAVKGYALSQHRGLPTGASLASDLPLRGIFHLPGAGAERRLEELILDGRLPVAVDSDLTQRLHRIADEIDRQSGKATGGLRLIGGAVAIVNPLLGIGIAAKAIFPSQGGAKATNMRPSAGSRGSTAGPNASPARRTWLTCMLRR